MTSKQALVALVLASLLIWGIQTLRGPYGTHLPLDTADLTPIQPQLDRLDAEERELVLGYLKRSRGDVLPAFLADPDEPFTARTFGEAIELQRQFLVLQAQRDAVAQARAAARDQAYAPLRAALAIQLVKREIMPRDQVLRAPALRETANGKIAKRAMDDKSILVTTYRLKNTSDSAIELAQASVMIRKAHREPADLGILNDCYFSRIGPLAVGASIELECGNTNKIATAADRAYIDMPDSEWVLEWEPQLIQFSDGKELKFKDID